jgi:transcriptional regulator with XRE-family HTH domain
MLGAVQIRAARALLGLNQRELSKIAGVATSTLKRIELAQELTGSARTLWKLQTALENAGVEFIQEDDLKGPGVRLRESTRPKSRRIKRKASG